MAPWLELCNTCFNFLQPIPVELRREIFHSFLSETHSPIPWSADKKVWLKAKLLVYAEELKDFKSSDDIWYRLLTDERFYENLKNINEVSDMHNQRDCGDCLQSNSLHPYASLKVSSSSTRALEFPPAL